MEIKVHNLSSLPKIDYRQLKPLQGELKTITEREYNKLKKSVRDFGFTFPFFVWFDQDKTPWIIDGHGRHKLCTSENVTPYELPYVEIYADDMIDAKKKLLTATSQYQKISQEGLDTFAIDLDAEWMSETVNFDSFLSPSIEDFPDLDYSEKNKEVDVDDFEDSMTIKLEYTYDEYQLVKEGLGTIANTPEQAVWKLLGL